MPCSFVRELHSYLPDEACIAVGLVVIAFGFVRELHSYLPDEACRIVTQFCGHRNERRESDRKTLPTHEHKPPPIPHTFA